MRGNRQFWLVDAEIVRLYNGKRCGAMVRIRPEWDDDTRLLALTFPDGERVEGTVELGEEVAAEMYGHPHPSRRVIGPWEDAISEFVGRPLTLLWAESTRSTAGYRGGTVSLVSRASLERLREEAGADEPVDGRRFRMLFEIDGVPAHEEDEWLGTQVRDRRRDDRPERRRRALRRHLARPRHRRHRLRHARHARGATGAKDGTSRCRSACTAPSSFPAACASAMRCSRCRTALLAAT